MINLADINRAGHWMNTHKIPLLPKVMQLIAFLFYSSAVSYKVKIGKGTFFNHGGFGVLINSNVVIGGLLQDWQQCVYRGARTVQMCAGA